MAEASTDHYTIRKWAEKKGGKPAAVESTHQGGDVGILFPERPESEHEALTEITWDEFFDEFEKRQRALLYDEDSNFNRIVGRDTLDKRQQGEQGAAR